MCQDQSQGDKRNLTVKMINDICTVGGFQPFKPRSEGKLQRHQCQSDESQADGQFTPEFAANRVGGNK
jgi:hypothetical protein